MAVETKNHKGDEFEQVYQQVMNCEPEISESELQPLADLVMNNERVVRQWRLTALLASKGGVFFREISQDAEMAKAHAPTVELLEDFASTMRMMAGLADCASSRLLVAGCNHQDFNAWMSKGD